MSAEAFAIVLLAAALHAAWNAIVKATSDKLLTTAMVTASAALVSAALLPFLPLPAPESWPFIAASVIIHIAYFAVVAWAYQATDMSQAYPLMRGTAPLLVAFLSAFWIGELLPVTAWIGVCAISLGILSMAITARSGNGPGISLALLNAFIIATYTLVDGIGVRLSEAPWAYTLWVFLVTGFLFAGWALAARRAAFVPYVRRSWRLGVAGGLGTLTSYGLVLWAMTVAPLALVAALRETSILFATAFAGLALSERIGFSRLGAICAVALGAALLRLR